MSRPIANSSPPINRSEQRIDRIAKALVALFVVAYWIVFRTWVAPLSVLAGAAVAWANYRWMSAGVTAAVLGANRKKIKQLVFKFLFRLLLILAVLYVSIRVSFVGLFGVLLGLSIFVMAMMAEAVLSLFSAPNR